jgi:DNA-binding response OmpR family regulator
MDNGRARPRIVLIEDDPALTMGLRDTLEFEGFDVQCTELGREGLRIARETRPDCIILDLMLPDMNGYDVCSEVRGYDARVPILMLTARGQESDKIRGFHVGADDYVTKPFSVGELVARVHAVCRRGSHPTPPRSFMIGHCVIDPEAHTVERDGKTSQLSFYELELLKLLNDRAGAAVSRDEILDRVWGVRAHPSNRTVDNFVVKLRKKIEPQLDRPQHILTVYGYGYKLVP